MYRLAHGNYIELILKVESLGLLLLAWTDPIDQPLDGNGLAFFHKLGR